MIGLIAGGLAVIGFAVIFGVVLSKGMRDRTGQDGEPDDWEDR